MYGCYNIPSISNGGRPSNVSALTAVQKLNQVIDQNLMNLESNNSEISNSEPTTSFVKQGNSQTPPVPPEFPKQGPIPPNCTLKPKF